MLNKKCLLLVELTFIFITIQFVSAAITFNSPIDAGVIYQYNSTGNSYTSLIVTNTTSNYFSDNCVPNDALYFGRRYSPFKDISFYIGTSFSGQNLSFVWEYNYNSQWNTLSVTDGCNNFITTGQCNVTFIPPSNWTNNYWAGLKFAPIAADTYYDFIRVRIINTSATYSCSEGGAQSTQKLQLGDDTIAITGGTSTSRLSMSNVYQNSTANNWDAVERIGDSASGLYTYKLKALLDIGNGSLATFFDLPRDIIYFDVPNGRFRILAGSNVTIGGGSGSSYGLQGPIISGLKLTYPTATYFSIADNTINGSAYNLRLSTEGYAASWTGSHVISFGKNSYINLLYETNIGPEPSVNFQGTTCYRCTFSGGWTTSQVNANTNFNDVKFWITSYAAISGFFYQGGGNLYIYKADASDVYGAGNETYGAQVHVRSAANMYLRDSYGFMYAPNIYHAAAGATSYLWRQWGFDLKVTDNNGNSISGANVTIYDNSNNLIYSGLTYANGTIAKQYLTDTKSYDNSTAYLWATANVVNYFNPYNITITSQNYTTKQFNFNITEPLDWVVALSSPTSASFILDKVASLQELNLTSITYNITLKATNIGGSSASSINLTDSDSSAGSYDLGTLTSGNSTSISYIKTYQRNSSNYNLVLSVASVNGTDSYSSNLITADSSQITIVIPATTSDTSISLTKNAEFLEENETSVTYNLSLNVINSGGNDLSEINVKDSDISLDASINLNRTQSYSTSGTKTILKTSANGEYTFTKANATYNSITYESNQILVLIPALESNVSLLLYKSVSLDSSTDTNITYNITLSLTNKGGRNATNAYVYDTDSPESQYSVGTLEAEETEARSYLKTFDKTTVSTSQLLSVAIANATDLLSGELVEANSSRVTVIIPVKPSSASFILDKIASFYNLTNETFTYNITLKLTNKGGSSVTNVNITDLSYIDSNFTIGTLSSGETTVRSYLLNFTRNSTTYYSSTENAQAYGIDSFSNSLISANSSSISLTIPSTETGEQLTVIKNIVYNNQTSDNVNYTISVEVVNSGGVDVVNAELVDSDLNKTVANPLIISKLNRTKNLKIK